MSRMLPGTDDAHDACSQLESRASRLARKGEYRKAAIALRELIALRETPRTWVRLGHMLLRARRLAEALDALKQGMWLHRKAGAIARAQTVARLVLTLAPADPMAGRFVSRSA